MVRARTALTLFCRKAMCMASVSYDLTEILPDGGIDRIYCAEDGTIRLESKGIIKHTFRTGDAGWSLIQRALIPNLG